MEVEGEIGVSARALSLCLSCDCWSVGLCFSPLSVDTLLAFTLCGSSFIRVPVYSCAAGPCESENILSLPHPTLST